MYAWRNLGQFDDSPGCNSLRGKRTNPAFAMQILGLSKFPTASRERVPQQYIPSRGRKEYMLTRDFRALAMSTDFCSGTVR